MENGIFWFEKCTWFPAAIKYNAKLKSVPNLEDGMHRIYVCRG